VAAGGALEGLAIGSVHVCCGILLELVRQRQDSCHLLRVEGVATLARQVSSLFSSSASVHGKCTGSSFIVTSNSASMTLVCPFMNSYSNHANMLTSY
jgi:hypothetical protein